MKAAVAEIDDKAIYLMGVEVGIQAVDRSGTIHVAPVMPELNQDPDFQRGFICGVKSEWSRLKLDFQGTPEIVRHDGVSLKVFQAEEDEAAILQLPFYLAQFADGTGLDRFHPEPVFDDRDGWGDDRLPLDANCRRKTPDKRRFPHDWRRRAKRRLKGTLKRARQIMQGRN